MSTGTFSSVDENPASRLKVREIIHPQPPYCGVSAGGASIVSPRHHTSPDRPGLGHERLSTPQRFDRGRHLCLSLVLAWPNANTNTDIDPEHGENPSITPKVVLTYVFNCLTHVNISYMHVHKHIHGITWTQTVKYSFTRILPSGHSRSCCSRSQSLDTSRIPRTPALPPLVVVT